MIPMSIAELNATHHATQPPGLRVPSSLLKEFALVLEEASAQPGAIARRKGDVPRAMMSAARTHTAVYRVHPPCYLGRVWASLDRAGIPIAWRHRVASTVRAARGEHDRAFEEEARAVDGAADIPYEIPNILIEHVGAESIGLDSRAWNGAGLAENAFTVESFVDELAVLSGTCPVNYRRRMLVESPRALAVLELAVSQSDWNAPPIRGTGRGLAMQAARRSFLALVAEIEVFGRDLHVGRVTCAMECGPAADRHAARQQVEDGILMGLESALGLFDDHRPPSVAPAIDVHFSGGPGDPEGIAESAAAAIAPAIANAIFTAAGNRIRTLPIVATPKEVS
jgi:isoquinoline 1-oxidoreductase subunit beta